MKQEILRARDIKLNNSRNILYQYIYIVLLFCFNELQMISFSRVYLCNFCETIITEKIFGNIFNTGPYSAP